MTRYTQSPSRPTRTAGPRRGRTLFSMALIVALISGVAAVGGPSPAEAATVRSIINPISPDRIDEVRWSDTYGAARSGGRSHIGVDIMGPKGVPLLAVKDATVTWGRWNNGTGSLIKIQDAEGWSYQYIHLNNDTPGTDDGRASCTQVFSDKICSTIGANGSLARGTEVKQGEVIGYLGDSGNAESTGAHLHFEIHQPDGTPINPTASVDAAALADTRPAVPPAAAPGEAGYVDHLWYQVNGRYPSPAEADAFGRVASAGGTYEAIATVVQGDTNAAAMDRLYLAFFNRTADTDGIRYWIGVRGSGKSSEAIAEWFADSAEFEARYGADDFSGFLDQLYQGVLKRTPDEQGKSYWLGQLENGQVTRGSIVVYFADSAELRGTAKPRSEVVATSLANGGSAPTQADVEQWMTIRTDNELAAAIALWFDR